MLQKPVDPWLQTPEIVARVRRTGVYTRSGIPRVGSFIPRVGPVFPRVAFAGVWLPILSISLI